MNPVVLRRTLPQVRGQSSVDINRHATRDWLMGRANAPQIYRGARGLLLDVRDMDRFVVLG